MSTYLIQIWIMVYLTVVIQFGETIDIKTWFNLLGWAPCFCVIVFLNALLYLFMEALHTFFLSTLAIVFGELGDKTQLLALVFAIRYRKAMPIILGIFAATLVNHIFAGFIGSLIGDQIPDNVMRWVMGILFIAIALWTLKPDTLDEDEQQPDIGRHSIFITVAITFFLAEMGDKTQVATIMLAAKFQPLYAVIAGTTLGMLIADVPTVLIGKLAAPKIPLKLIRICAAIIFAVIGILILLGVKI